MCYPITTPFGQRWAARLTTLLPGVVLIGIDEHTGLIDDGPGSRLTSWRVYGQGNVTIYRQGQPLVYGPGQQFDDTFRGLKNLVMAQFIEMKVQRRVRCKGVKFPQMARCIMKDEGGFFVK